MLFLLQAQPAVGKEVIDLRSLCGGEPGQHVLHVLEWINVQALAGFDQAHDGRSRLSTLFRASEQPVAPRNDHWLDVAFAGIIANLDKRVPQVDQQSRPAVERIRNGIGKLCFRRFDQLLLIEPFFQQQDFWFCQSLAKVGTLRCSERHRKSFDIEQALNDAHGKFCGLRIRFPGVFEVAVHMRPTIGCCSSIFNDLVELVGSVGQQNSGEAFQYPFRVDRVLSVSVLVKDVGIISVSTIDPDESPVGLAETLFDHRQSGGIRLNDLAAQNQLAHPLDNWIQQSGCFCEPSAHGRAIDRNAQGFEYRLLPVKRQVKPELVGCNFCKQPWTRQTFVDGLIWFLTSNNLSAAFSAGIFEDNVLDCLKCFWQIKL